MSGSVVVIDVVSSPAAAATVSSGDLAGSVDLDNVNDLEKRLALEVQIGEFGQVPKQLFTTPHPQRMAFTVQRPLSSCRRSLRRSCSSVRDFDPGWVGRTSAAPPDGGNGKCGGGGLWKTRMENLRMVCDYKAHKERLSTVSISADKLWIFSASHENQLKMHSLEETSLLRTVIIGSKGVNISCCFPLPNNKTLLIGSKDNSICTYSIEYGRTHEFDSAHRDAVSCMDWRNGLLATGSWDGAVKVWHATEVTGQSVSTNATSGSAYN